MAGSLKWFVYQTDNGTDFAIELDESNTEAINAGNNDYVANTGIIFAVPKNVTPRYAFYANTPGTRVIKVVALTPTIFNGLVANARTITDPIDVADTLTLVRVRPEIIRLPYPNDTGIDDGDDN